jgi:hypothetical protein
VGTDGWEKGKAFLEALDLSLQNCGLSLRKYQAASKGLAGMLPKAKRPRPITPENIYCVGIAAWDLAKIKTQDKKRQMALDTFWTDFLGNLAKIGVVVPDSWNREHWHEFLVNLLKPSGDRKQAGPNYRDWSAQVKDVLPEATDRPNGLINILHSSIIDPGPENDKYSKAAFNCFVGYGNTFSLSIKRFQGRTAQQKAKVWSSAAGSNGGGRVLGFNFQKIKDNICYFGNIFEQNWIPAKLSASGDADVLSVCLFEDDTPPNTPGDYFAVQIPKYTLTNDAALGFCILSGRQIERVNLWRAVYTGLDGGAVSSSAQTGLMKPINDFRQQLRFPAVGFVEESRQQFWERFGAWLPVLDNFDGSQFGKKGVEAKIFLGKVLRQFDIKQVPLQHFSELENLQKGLGSRAGFASGIGDLAIVTLGFC